MTPEELEKIVKDYAENGLPEGSALICLHGGKNNFGTIYGKGLNVATTVAINMFASRDFAEFVRLACEFYDAEGGQEKAEAAKTVSKYLDRMGFKRRSRAMKIVRKKNPPKRQVLERIAQQLDGSTISNEAFVATLFTEALSIILQDLDDRIRATYITNGVMVAGEPESILSGMKDYCDAARRQVAEYYRSISRRLEECTYDYKGAECYDSFRRSANDVARIVMKMADKGKEEGVLARIEEFIDTFEAQGRFTEEDYKRFILR